MSKGKLSIIPPGTEALIISACMLGDSCSCNGTNKKNDYIAKLSGNYNVIKICPEVLAGLPIPRQRSEIKGRDGGSGVLKGKAAVISEEGRDLSSCFITGARKTLKMARSNNCTCAILKSKSPSCGSGSIYDGTFKGRLKRGDGVTAAFLKANGILVITEEEFI